MIHTGTYPAQETGGKIQTLKISSLNQSLAWAIIYVSLGYSVIASTAILVAIFFAMRDWHYLKMNGIKKSEDPNYSFWKK